MIKKRLPHLMCAGAIVLASFSQFSFSKTPEADDGSVKLSLEPERELFVHEKNERVVVRLAVEGVPLQSEREQERLPVNLSVVLDRSGSMKGDKISKAIDATCELINQLGPRDTFSLVAYSNDSEVLISPRHIEDRDALKRIVRRIRSGGGTALYDGVRLGSRQLDRFFDREKVNRVILLSDGQANEGPSQPSDLHRLGLRLRDQGVGVTTVGLGNDYNEDLMIALAEASVSNYYFVENSRDLPGIFEQELGDLRNMSFCGLKCTTRLRVKVH
ncbi:MAG: vWA domain-containing protein, partial [Opitutales bacterium]